MDLLELIIIGLIKLFSQPQNQQQQRVQSNQMEAIRQRMAAARQQQDPDVLVARMPPPVQQTVRQASPPQKPSTARIVGQLVNRATTPQKQIPQTRTPQKRILQKQTARSIKRAVPPPVPNPPPALKPLPAPPPIARAKPAVAIHHTGIETSTRWLSHASLRTAIVASEILQPPLSLRE